jgi:flagellar biogenesis protein FliO
MSIGRLVQFVIACSAFTMVKVAYAEETPQVQLPWAAPKAAPLAASTDDQFEARNSVLRMIGGLFLCLGCLGGGLHLYKRFVIPRAKGDGRRLQVVERLPLSSKSSLLLVKLDGKEFMLSTGPEAARLISPPRTTEDLFDESLINACDDVGEVNAQ